MVEGIHVIEDVLFRVPQYQLVRHSETLADMFNVPQGDGVDAPVEGRSKEHPICFEGISIADFRNFLRPLFPYYSWRSTELNTEEWLSILKLSTMWYCLALRQSAVEALTSLLDDPMQKILFGREYFVVQWVQDGYRALVLRHETISDEEITEEGLGYPAGTKLLRMREQYWRSNSERGTAWLKTTASIDEHIKHVFKVELDGIRVAQTGMSDNTESERSKGSLELVSPTEAVTPSLTPDSLDRKEPDIVAMDDPDYYIQGEFVVFQLPLRQRAEVFASMFMCPQPLGPGGEGSTSSSGNPIFLPYTTVSDFKNFLKALYPRSFDVLLSLSKEEWFSVLTLSNQWYFRRMRAVAIAELNTMTGFSSIEKITLGRNLKVASWVVQGFLELILRAVEVGISDDEAKKISLMTTIDLLRIRESKAAGKVSSTTSSIVAMIETKFKEELGFIRAEEQGYGKVFEDIAGNEERNENIKKKKKRLI
ncbi:hypothetical protein NLJ89_g4697 [Agrocybe chaxingu]|uniref:BTB domain-containing protein n=1 Tax=Agrocybe chaxingu TaxID=84603 RepID=A0A9W8K3K4_9AGAR|nr:hypothetical protein NLJ89_g4697 [Agrocybe chaxingu]